MKILLFLYPISPYIDHQIEWYPGIEEPIRKLNELIELRYRKQGYIVYWLLFSEKGNRKQPDLQLLHPEIEIGKHDQIISAGLDFKRHTDKKIYPNLNFITNQLPNEITEVKVGGYHMYDCCHKVARRIHHLGISTLIDEDLTDRFFSNMSIDGSIPPFREFTLEGFGYNKILDDEDDYIKKLIINRRRNKPWLVQPE